MSGAGAVRVWLLDSGRCGAALEDCERITPRLAEAETARAAAFADAEDGRRWRLARIALRLLLESAGGRGVRRRPFAAAGAGKPELAPPQDRPLGFSIARSGRWALIAIGPERVGADLEQERQLALAPSRRAALLAAAAALRLGEGTGPEAAGASAAGDAALVGAWVRLEAWAKARGSGIGRLLSDLGLSGPAAPLAGAGAAERAAELLGRERLLVEDLALPRGLLGAVAGPAECALPATAEELTPGALREAAAARAAVAGTD